MDQLKGEENNMIDGTLKMKTTFITISLNQNNRIRRSYNEHQK
jgi:hypothetical protein